MVNDLELSSTEGSTEATALLLSSHEVQAAAVAQHSRPKGLLNLMLAKHQHLEIVVFFFVQKIHPVCFLSACTAFHDRADPRKTEIANCIIETVQ